MRAKHELRRDGDLVGRWIRRGGAGVRCPEDEESHGGTEMALVRIGVREVQGPSSDYIVSANP